MTATAWYQIDITGVKTLSGLIKKIKQHNKRLNKCGAFATLTINLPIKNAKTKNKLA